jgi:O-antigen ligase
MVELIGRTGRIDPRRLRGKHQSAAAVIVLAWAAVVMPSLVQSFTAPKNRNFTSDTETASAASSLVNLTLTVTLTGLLLLLLVRYLNDLPTDRRGVLVVLLLPWLYQVSRDTFAGTSLRLGGLLYPLIVVVIWILRPKLQQLAILGYLIGLTALISVLMGALDPAKGILSSTEGSIITPDKQLLPWGILIGPLTDGNPLGQFLALGLPAAVYIRHRGWRWSIFLITSFAVLWTSNRSSLAALIVGLTVAALLKLAPRGTRRLSTAVIITSFAAVVAYLPLTTTQNDAFTNRGYIWTASLRHWESHPLIGLGSQWYSQSAKYANNIGPTAFHGHNQVVQILVLGGLINLALVTMMLIALVRAAARWAEFRAVTVPAAFLAMLLTSGALEVSLSFVHRSFLLPVTVLTITYMCFAEEEREAAPIQPVWPAPGAGAPDRPPPSGPPEPPVPAQPEPAQVPVTVPMKLPQLPATVTPFSSDLDVTAPIQLNTARLPKLTSIGTPVTHTEPPPAAAPRPGPERSAPG